MKNQKLMENPLKSKDDVSKALHEMLHPLEKYFETSRYGLKFDSGGSYCDERTREIEALLRPLWGIFPLICGGGEYKGYQKYLSKIICGTNIHSDSFWGDIIDFDQKIVEMAVIGFGMIIARKHIWDNLTSSEQENLYNWLKKINHHDMPANNWRFFRILVNLGLKNCGCPYDEERMKADLQFINSCYIDNGWYFDGLPDQMDYYNPFAMHFYALIYAAACPDDDVYTPLFIERAKKFAQSFAAYFDNSGAAVPYGRSLVYRFAQSSFWGALAYAGIEALPWGQVKYLALQNLRYWFKQDIFSSSGELTIGYHYRNSNMAEGYNAFGSPYWALKSFIMLAVPEEHPFWTSKETAPNIKPHVFIPEARCIIQGDASQIQLYPVGQQIHSLVHSPCKYGKFVYSSVFGFSVQRAPIGAVQGAFDNTLAVSEADEYFRMRDKVEEYRVFEDYLYSEWKPWDDVSIKSYVIPVLPWHIRIHKINSKRPLSLSDGGYAINNDANDIVYHKSDGKAYIRSKNEISGIVCLLGSQVTEHTISSEPNSNLMHPRCSMPLLLHSYEPGEYIIASAVLGAKSEAAEEIWCDVPVLKSENERYIVSHIGREIKISN